MLARLQRETKTCHAAADEDRLAILASAPTLPVYRQFLTRIHGFEGPVEATLARAPQLDEWIDVRGRTQLRLLRADLAALGVLDPARLPRCANVPPFEEPAAALGWIYVLERNARLHGVIERHLRGALPEPMKQAGSYLGGRARSAGVRWRELGDTLDRLARSLYLADAIVQAARAAFRVQHGWYAQAAPTQRVA